MHLNASIEYLACGANRYPSCADWDPVTGILGFGSGRNIALWGVSNETPRGITGVLRGHADTVTAIKFFHTTPEVPPYVLSGSADHTIRIWKSGDSSVESSNCIRTLEDHKGSINCLATLASTGIFASGAADGSVKIWRVFESGQDHRVELLQDLQVSPRIIPLALSLAALKASHTLVLAVGGTRNVIQIYASPSEPSETLFDLQANLPGHDAWVRSLEFKEDPAGQSNLLLASASQDKYIRLWRIRQRSTTGPASAQANTYEVETKQLISNKSHVLKTINGIYDITFEALLLGHEDWIYTVRWNPNAAVMQLLSASADNSLVIWEPDQASGIWVCKTRLGDLSIQKGSTTATGSSGGLWVGLWTENGGGLVALGRSGSWRRWTYDEKSEDWAEKIGVSGHTGEVRDLAWSQEGLYLLSVSADQTTRAHAMWQNGNFQSWHEYARPQIHGYDLNCVGSLSAAQFASGADEKLVRVFDAPHPFIATLSGDPAVKYHSSQALSDAESGTTVPVLGLSNKAVGEKVNRSGGNDAQIEGNEGAMPKSLIGSSIKTSPPLEDQLAKQTLWPEREKLYGHGFEMSALAISSAGDLVATSCKASSLEHAVIRLYDAKTWRALNPPLEAHSLTVTNIVFSDDDKYLLSVGRDRRCTVFENSASEQPLYVSKFSDPKGHSRMILGCAWAPSKFGRVFGTAGRDKACKIWSLGDSELKCMASVPTESAATSVAFGYTGQDKCVMAVGTETGAVTLHVLDNAEVRPISTFELDTGLVVPSSTIGAV